MPKKNILFKLSFADSFTILNGIFGLFSIFFIIKGQVHYSFIFILLAVLADGMDGIIARRYGGYLGEYMDEFSDTVSFCVAPCIFSYVVYGMPENLLFFVSVSIFLIFGMLHLINYHMNKRDYFIGLPTPASAIIISSMSYLEFNVWILIAVFFLSSFIMVLPLNYPRIEKYFSVIACIIIFLAMTGENILVFLLIVSTSVYIILGPLYTRIIKGFLEKF
ncbi:MAG TPA: hypothetical protein ENI52_04355 [Thermoplasmata archaeon]|nr:hypothetical protein [Thermoplasmata archaeon]